MTMTIKSPTFQNGLLNIETFLSFKQNGPFWGNMEGPQLFQTPISSALRCLPEATWNTKVRVISDEWGDGFHIAIVCGDTPWKIQIVNPNMEVWRMIFLFNWVMFRWTILIFRGVPSLKLAIFVGSEHPMGSMYIYLHLDDFSWFFWWLWVDVRYMDPMGIHEFLPSKFYEQITNNMICLGKWTSPGFKYLRRHFQGIYSSNFRRVLGCPRNLVS